MSDAPETQKAVLDSDGQWSFVLKDCCERLERERDEARNELCDIRLNLGEDAEGYTLTHAVCVLQNERNEAMEDSLEQARLLGMGSEREAKLISERDEAREKAERYRLDANALMLQRDEAREEANKLSGAYEDATNYYARIIELKEERDEAREALKHIEEYGTEEINAAVELRQKLASALVERDEAREKYATEATEHMLAINKVCNERDLRQTERIRYLEGATNHACGTPLSVALRERDKAMEALMKIEDLFIDGTDIYADRESMGLIAREALGETK